VFRLLSDVKIDSVSCFETFVAIDGRKGGFSQIWVFDPASPVTSRKQLEFAEKAHSVGISSNMEYGAKELRLVFQSLTTPKCTFDYVYSTGKMELKKQMPVPNYDSKLYASERVVATAADGVQVPISLVWRKDRQPKDKSTPRPMHLYGYGSYEICIDPEFSVGRLPLLDRGVVFAIGM
jgi:oligopeptidase B